MWQRSFSCLTTVCCKQLRILTATEKDHCSKLAAWLNEVIDGFEEGLQEGVQKYFVNF